MIGSFIKVSFTEKGMILSPFQKQEIELNHISNGIFQLSDKVNPSHLLYEDENAKYLTTGIYTLQKINGWKIFLVATSLIIGLIGFVIVLIYGVYQMIRVK
jgi:hypothetical protein